MRLIKQIKLVRVYPHATKLSEVIVRSVTSSTSWKKLASGNYSMVLPKKNDPQSNSLENTKKLLSASLIPQETWLNNRQLESLLNRQSIYPKKVSCRMFLSKSAYYYLQLTNGGRLDVASPIKFKEELK